MSHKRNATRYKYKKQESERLKRLIQAMTVGVDKLMYCSEVQEEFKKACNSYVNNIFSQFASVIDCGFTDSDVRLEVKQGGNHGY